MLIGRALTNVIENALHAMPGGGTLTIDAALAPDHMVQLRVTDTGVGMDAAALGEDLRAVLLDEGDRHRPGPDDCEAQRRGERRHDRGDVREADAAPASR